MNYAYDELGRRKDVKENGTTVLAGWSYPDMLNATVTYGNTTTRVTQRTLTGDLAQLTNANGYAPNTMNQYASVDAVTQSYNNNGNLTGDGTWSYGFDYENRLTSAVKAGVTASYGVDAFGRRAQKSVNGATTNYLLDGDTVIEEYDGAGTRSARYVYAPGVDQPIYMERGVNRYFYHFDGSGSVIVLTGASGIVSERYTYGPFGETASTSAVGDPYRYTGRELDEEPGLITTGRGITVRGWGGSYRPTRYGIRMG